MVVIVQTTAPLSYQKVLVTVKSNGIHSEYNFEGVMNWIFKCYYIVV